MSSEELRSAAEIAGAEIVTERLMVALAQSMERRRVDYIVLKGLPTSRWLFPERRSHVSTDIDVLVDPRCAISAANALNDLHFRPLLLDVTPGDRPNHARPFTSEEWALQIDLHSTLIGATVPTEIVWSELEAHSTLLPLSGERIPILDTPGRALMVVLHAAQNGPLDSRTTGYLERAANTIQSDVWVTACEIAYAIGAEQLMSLGLSLTESSRAIAGCLDLPTPSGVTHELLRRSAPPEAHAVEWFLRLEGVRPRASFVLHKLFPPKQFMRSWHHRAGEDGLQLTLAYIQRWIWLAKRAPEAIRSYRRARQRSRSKGRA